MQEALINATKAVVANATAAAATSANLKFSWYDYLFFVILLGLSAAIGVYFGFYQKKEATADEYLLGGKEMGVFEISLSLIASTISGITILAVPSEIYRYGIHYWLCAFASVFVLIFSYYCVMPVFTKLKTPSTYEYLNTRFGESIRGISSLLFTLCMFLYLPIVIYTPALALAHGTDLNIHMITPVICGVCIFYTTVGGLKAVVWTDALQFVVMIGAILVVTFVGTVKSGGIAAIWSAAQEGGRLDLNFDLTPTTRDTFWSNFVGMFFLWNGIITFSQGTVQKCLALPNYRKVKQAYIAFGIGIFLFFTFSMYMALMIYARYRNCDPHMTSQIKKHDEILPYYILDVTRNIPGLPGIFVAGIFSASLSTLSAAMNALSCTLYEDFILRWLPKDVKPQTTNLILKAIVVSVGVISTLLVLVVENFQSILQVGLSFGSFTFGPTLGLFTLGMFVPMANTKGALCGTIGSLLVMGWIIFTASYYHMSGYMVESVKGLSVDGCDPTKNFTIRGYHTESEWTPPAIYRVSHYYYCVMGGVLVHLIGIPVSYFTRTPNETPVHKDLISPAMYWALPDADEKIIPEYYSVEKANAKVTAASAEKC